MFPPLSISLLLAAFFVCRYENQSWVKADSGIPKISKAKGLKSIAMFASGLFAMIFGFAWSLAYASENGWLTLLGIFLIGLGASLAWIVVITILLGRSNFRAGYIPEFWAIGTVGVWATALLLYNKVSWFGLAN